MIRGADPGPLANYNSLTDKHLSGYFANLRMRKHLMKSGLVSRDGVVTSESAYRLKMAKLEHRKHVRDFLASAIVEKALDMERLRQHEIRKRLDELYKIELVNKIKSDRASRPTGEEELIALLSPQSKFSPSRMVKSATHYNKEQTRLPNINFDGRNQSTYEGNHTSKSSTQQALFKPHPPPGKIKKKKKTHRGLKLARSDLMIGHRIQLQSMAEVTMKYLGSSLNLANDMFPSNRLSEIQVVQQHCGGNTVCIFRELLPPNTIFTFVSRRHRGSPFGLTININGIRNIRLSSCCEYKHTPGYKIGGKNSQFMLVSVQGAAPCYRCQVQLKMNSGNNPNDKENDSSSDEEEAANSFDVIVSRAGHRSEQKRPVSAAVHTATQTMEEKGNHDYVEAQFEEDDEEKMTGLHDSKLTSEESSESESDVDNEKKSKERYIAKEKKSDSSNSEEGEEKSYEQEKELLNYKDNKPNEQDESPHPYSEQKASINSSDDENDSRDTNSDEPTETHEDQRSENGSDLEESDSDTESIHSNNDQSSKLSDTDGHEENNSIKKDTDNKIHIDKYKGSENNKDDSDKDDSEKDDSDNDDSDGHFDQKEDNEENVSEKKATRDGGFDYDSSYYHESTSGQQANTNDTIIDPNNSKNEEANLERKLSVDYESSFEKDTDKDDKSDDDDASEKRSGYMSSVISRESTMLTGNEDGHFDSANKTIQFNEEVDVVHYAKNDEVSPQLTPRSDEDISESDYNFVKNTDGRVILTDLGQSSDDEAAEKLSEEEMTIDVNN